jgi:hypothetical protein
MTQSHIMRVSGAEAYDLIYAQHLAMLSTGDQESMHRHMVNSSRVWLSLIGGQISGCCGLIPPTLLSDRAYLWLYTTQHLTEHQFMFIRYSQRVVEEALREFPLIVGHTRTTDRKAIRWLRWLGAVYSEPQGQVLPFEIRAKS